MSKMIARQVLDRMSMHDSMISVQHVNAVIADMQMLADAQVDKENAKFEERKVEMLEAYGFERSTVRKPFAFSNGIAVIPVHGSLINRFGACWGYVTGYNFIRSQLNAAIADDDVKAIVFDCNSYGGEVAGCFELVDDIFEARAKKPSMAMVDSNSYSACYAVASAAGKVVVTPTGGAGSVGVVAMHISFEEALKEWGLKVSFIYAGAHKVDGNPYEDLPDDVRADIQRGVDKSYERFVSVVARNRGLDAKAVRDTEARVFRAEEALSLGLIDAVESPAKAVAAFFNELSGSTNDEEESPMNEEEQAALEAKHQRELADARAQAGADAQARISSILDSEEAKANVNLANHLAFNTTMSVEEATQAIAAAGPAAAVTPTPAPAVAANPFKATMDTDKQPNLGGGGGEGGDEQSAAQFILNSQASATGRKHKTA